MNSTTNDAEIHRTAEGQLNRGLGWTMIVLGMFATMLIDPWYFQVDQHHLSAGGLRQMTRHAQGVLLAMALLQLAVAHLLRIKACPLHSQRQAAWLTSSGAIIYCIGYSSWFYWPPAHWIVLVGSLLNLSGFALLWLAGPTGPYASHLRVILPVVCFGMLLDFASGLFLMNPEWPFIERLGPSDGVRQRMLRLARVAAIALSVLVLLYEGLITRIPQRSRSLRWGQVAMVVGAVGMPTILAAACFFSLHIKYLLPLPATAILLGVSVGLYYAWKETARLEVWGWSLILTSLSVGMLMGLYAFAGPLPKPSFLGEYLMLARQRSILAHSYAIVLGLIAIFVTRQWSHTTTSNRTKLGTGLLISGSLVTIGILTLGTLTVVPATALAVGPAIAGLGIVVCLITSVSLAAE